MTPFTPARLASVLPLISSATPASSVTVQAPMNSPMIRAVGAAASGRGGWATRSRRRRPGLLPGNVAFQRGCLRDALITYTPVSHATTITIDAGLTTPPIDVQGR